MPVRRAQPEDRVHRTVHGLVHVNPPVLADSPLTAFLASVAEADDVASQVIPQVDAVVEVEMTGEAFTAAVNRRADTLLQPEEWRTRRDSSPDVRQRREFIVMSLQSG